MLWSFIPLLLSVVCQEVAGQTPSPTASPTAFPTVSTTGVVLFEHPGATAGNLGSASTTNAACDATAGTLGLSQGTAYSFLSYTGRTIQNFPTLFGFPSSHAIYSVGGTTIATSYANAMAGSLSSTLQDAGVTTNSFYWTGSTASGGLSFNCDGWSTTSSGIDGGAGDSTVTYSAWLLQDLFPPGWLPCNNPLTYLCLYVYPTPSPTQAPTAPTNSPTSSPTASPTNSPTSPTQAPTAPTKSPTGSPTSSPTNSPTSSPTPSPTNSPTHEPTAPPTQVIKGRVMYKISSGLSLGFTRNTKNVSFSMPLPPPQVTLSGTTTGGTPSLIPVQWSGLYARVYNATSLTTETLYQTGPCNPAVESVPPGTSGQLLPDGTEACISVYTCDQLSLGSDCELVDLEPDMSGVWTTPRTCLCNVTLESTHPFYPTKVLDAPEEFSLWKAEFTVIDPQPNPFDVFGSIDCRNPIDREVNCQLFCIDPQYPLACITAPIQCYCSIDQFPPEDVGGQMTVGRFFGLFWNLNPKFIYNIPRDQWSLAHYTGIGSLMNNLMYFTSDLEYQDPFNPQVWKLYYWVNVSSTGFVSEEVTPQSETYTSFVLQTSPLQYTQDGTPPLAPDYSLPIGPSVSNVECQEGNLDGCDESLWSTDAGPSYRRPGRELNFNLTGTLITMTMTINEPLPYITGVEVRTPQGELCGSYFPGGFDTGEEYVFVCSNLPNSEFVSNGWVQVRLLGVNSMYDLPYMLLNEVYQTCEYFDPLVLDLQTYTSYVNLSLPLPLSEVYDLAGNQTWPTWTPFSGYMAIAPNITWVMNYTTGPTNGSAFLPDEVPLNILNYNQYPFFDALEDRVNAEGWGSRAIDYTDPNDLDFLYYVWTTWLAPMQCSESWQCQTFQQGLCLFPDGDFKIRWRNGDADDLYPMISGDEGGCECFNQFTKGFFNPSFFCSTCVTGYGPLTLDEWGLQIQFNNIAGGVLFPSDEYPFNLFAATPTSSPTGSPTLAPTTPTSSPTTPTSSPTSSPTSPTSSPTTPTSSPTSSPTQSPTSSPTEAPTSPTFRPSDPPLTAFPTSLSPTEAPTTFSPSSSPTTGFPTQSPEVVTLIPTGSPTSFPLGTSSPTTGPALSLFESLLQCRLVMGPDPVVGGGVNVCNGHGLLSLSQYTSESVVYDVLGYTSRGGEIYSTCQHGLLIDGVTYDLIEGDYPIRLIQVFSSSTTTYVFIQATGGLEVYKTTSTASELCSLSSCSQQMPPVCTLTCANDEEDGGVEMACLNNDLWVAGMDVSPKPIQLNNNILLFTFETHPIWATSSPTVAP